MSGYFDNSTIRSKCMCYKNVQIKKENKDTNQLASLFFLNTCINRSNNCKVPCIPCDY